MGRTHDESLLVSKPSARFMKYDKDIVVAWFKAHGIEAIPEYKFHPTRKWRFDFLLPNKVALEVQGGLFSGGRHGRGAALMKEHEKLNHAACMGYRVLYCIPQNLCMEETLEFVRQAIAFGEEI